VGLSSHRQAAVTDDLDALLAIFPASLREAIENSGRRGFLIEVVLDLGRQPEARYVDGAEWLSAAAVRIEDLHHIVTRAGRFGKDNRAGIARTLHRISALRNRLGEVVGLTCRVGRAVVGTLDIVRDAIETGDSVLLVGRPGVGKTTLLREAARVLADDFGKRVVVVDTSNEIAGDGDIPHPGIGRARRMQVPSPEEQHAVMIEAIENHMPEVIVIDEIGTSAEAQAARTIAERGVQLIATAHGNTLDNLLQNPTLSDLVGGVQAVILSDEEARRRGSQKTVLERRSPPTFQTVIEIQDKDRFAVHRQVADVVDRALRGQAPAPEVRLRKSDGAVEIVRDARTAMPLPAAPGRAGGQPFGRRVAGGRTLRVFPYAVSRSKLERAARDLRVPVQIVQHPDEADLVLALKSQERRQPPRLRAAQQRGTPLYSVRGNTSAQLHALLRVLFGFPGNGHDDDALAEAEEAIEQALRDRQPIELEPRPAPERRLQHEAAARHGLTSASHGEEPRRRVVILPAGRSLPA